ncbi:MAG: hypothetical protein SFW67_20810 [Myxococcaceae bacterium]|nr:hypothetical protein [Myxococcaceae bacterium]
MALLVGCGFDPSVAVDDDGRTTVTCEAGASCPAGLRCGVGICVDPARVRPVVVGDVSVRRPDGSASNRFSRTAGFNVAFVEVPIEGAPTAVELQLGVVRVPCGELERARFRCELRVDSNVGEDLVAQLVVRDLRGDEQRRAVPLIVDLTAPALVEGSAAAFVTPPPESPLRFPLAPTAVAAGSTVRLQFSLSEAVVSAPRVAVTGATASVATTADGNGVYGAQLVLAGPLADRTTFEVEATDLVGNTASLRLPVELPATKPAPPFVDPGPMLERVPFGRIDGGLPGLRLVAPLGAGAGSLAVWESPDAGFPLSLTELPLDGSRLEVPLPVRDLSRVWVSRVNAAGESSARELVRAISLTVRPTSGFGNPSLVEARPAFVDPLVVPQPETLEPPPLTALDGEGVSVDSQALWRPEGTDVRPCTDDLVVADRAAGQGLRFSGFSVGGCDGTALLRQTGLALERVSSGLPFDTQASFFSWDPARRRALTFGESTFLNAAGFLLLSGEGARAAAVRLTGGAIAGAFDVRRDRHVLVTKSREVWAVAGDFRGAFVSLGSLPALGDVAALTVPTGGVLVWQQPRDGGSVSTWRVDGAGLTAAGTLPPNTRPTWVPTAGLYGFSSGQVFEFVDGGFTPLDAGVAPPIRGLGWEEGRGPVLFAGADRWLVRPGALERTDGGSLPGEAFPRVAAPPEFSRGLGAVGGGTVLAAGPQAQRWFMWSAQGWASIGSTVLQPRSTPLAVAGTETDAYLFVPDAGLFRRPLLGGGGLSLVRPYQAALTPVQAVSTGNAIVVVSEAPPLSVWFPVDGGSPETASVVPPNATQYGVYGQGCLVGAGRTPVLGFGNVIGTSIPQPRRFVERPFSSTWVQLPAAWEDIDRPSCSFEPAGQRVLSFGGAIRRIATNVNDDAVLRVHALDGGSATLPVWGPWGEPAGRTDALFAHDAASGRHLLWGGTTGTTGRTDGWSLEVSTVRPGVVWRVPLEPLDVPLSATLQSLEVRAVAGGSAPAGGGVELLGWTAGAWRRPLWAHSGAVTTAPGFQALEATFSAAELLELDVRSVAITVRTVGAAGPGVARVSVDAAELTLHYMLGPEER